MRWWVATLSQPHVSKPGAYAPSGVLNWTNKRRAAPAGPLEGFWRLCLFGQISKGLPFEPYFFNRISNASVKIEPQILFGPCLVNGPVLNSKRHDYNPPGTFVHTHPVVLVRWGLFTKQKRGWYQTEKTLACRSHRCVYQGEGAFTEYFTVLL